MLSSSIAVAQGRSAAWKPGEFSGLVAGKSTRKDVIRMLGANEPRREKLQETYTYSGKGDFSSTLIIEVNRATGVVDTITEQFSPNITRTQAHKKYGNDYREVQYSIADCPHEGVNPLAYRDPKGLVELIEYPQKGLILWPNREGFDIAAAVYLARPLPGKKPACAKR
ncbi:MAG: hypothetical protein ACM3JB_13755 [Acidobacteriaceae bacterium]